MRINRPSTSPLPPPIDQHHHHHRIITPLCHHVARTKEKKEVLLGRADAVILIQFNASEMQKMEVAFAFHVRFTGDRLAIDTVPQFSRDRAHRKTIGPPHAVITSILVATRQIHLNILICNRSHSMLSTHSPNVPMQATRKSRLRPRGIGCGAADISRVRRPNSAFGKLFTHSGHAGNSRLSSRHTKVT